MVNDTPSSDVCRACGGPLPPTRIRDLCHRCFRQTPEEREKQRAYRQTEGYKQAQVKYVSTDAGRANLKERRDRHRDKRRGLERSGPKLTGYQWRQIKRAYDGICAYCGERPGTQPDHVIPLTKGGTHTRDNIVPCCPPCNQQKLDNLGWTPRPPVRIVQF